MRNLFLVATLVFPMLAASQEMGMAPPKELSVFNPMLGKWSGNVSMNMGGMKSEAKMTMNCQMDGQFIRCQSVMAMEGMKMVETQYIGWDAEKGMYSSTTFTNYSPKPRIEWGTVKGNTSVWLSEPWETMPGQKTESRATLVIKSKNEVEFTLEFKQGDKFEKVGYGLFKR